MFGRTTRLVLLLLASQLASGCCCCHRPWFWRWKWQGGCCEPCTTCCSNPAMPAAPLGPPHAVYPAPVVMPPPPVAPAGNPPSDRMTPISSAAMSTAR